MNETNQAEPTILQVPSGLSFQVIYWLFIMVAPQTATPDDGFTTINDNECRPRSPRITSYRDTLLGVSTTIEFANMAQTRSSSKNQEQQENSKEEGSAPKMGIPNESEYDQFESKNDKKVDVFARASSPKDGSASTPTSEDDAAKKSIILGSLIQDETPLT
ncbi:MAG: hypothetical protein ACREOZ_04300, partial [Gloeomargaritales cyanobacterium]